MDLLGRLNAQSLLRPVGKCERESRICLIVFSRLLEYLDSFIRANPGVEICRMAVPDLADSPHKEIRLELDGQESIVPLHGFQGIVDCPELEHVFFAPLGMDNGFELEIICRAVEPYGVRNIRVWSPNAITWPGRQCDQQLYQNNKSLLEQVFSLFADEASRNVYAARIKAVITGNPGYLPISSHSEYYHPLVQPEPDDVLIDGGVSDMVGAQRAFAQSVGKDGVVYGFEPIPDMFESARQQLADLPQYRLFPIGLARTPGEAHFSLMRDSSRVSTQGEHTRACPMTSIDTFVAKQGLERVDCIKLDVEGSELAALMGARQTITSMRPKLIVCLYHKKEDLWEIPPLIKRFVPEYKLYLAHSSSSFLDTILYATVG